MKLNFCLFICSENRKLEADVGTVSGGARGL